MDAINSLLNTIGNECKRMGNEVVENFTADVKEIEDGVKNGGLGGGALAFFDVTSVGHQAANMLDAANVIPEGDESLKELISAGINLASLGPSQLLAVKDVADSIGHIVSANAAKAAPGMPSAPNARCTSAPTSMVHCPGASLVAGAVQRPDQVSPGGPLRYGLPGCDAGQPDPAGRIRDIIGKSAELERQIDKILANPNLCFEDMIFLLMRTVMKLAREEVKGFKDELKGLKTDGQTDRDAMQAQFDSLQEEATSAQRRADETGDPADLDRARRATNKANNFGREMGDALSDRSEARADAFEELKLMMQRLTEMEQALSNVLNTMHEGAMAAIRNIR